MRQKERIAMILNILKENGYVNVKYLCSEIGYSKATINRDLNFMEKQKLVHRSYGGVELVENRNMYIPLEFRYHRMKNEKKNICKVAADMVKDGDTVFIPSVTTGENIVRYLLNKKDITVITNNMSIIRLLSDFPNIKSICLGGEIVESPSMLGGDLCIKNILTYKADKMFFSMLSINDKGEIGEDIYNLVLNAMAQNSKEIICMVDHSKINKPFKTVAMTVDDVDVILSDYTFSDEFKNRYKNTRFIEV